MDGDGNMLVSLQRYLDVRVNGCHTMTVILQLLGTRRSNTRHKDIINGGLGAAELQCHPFDLIDGSYRIHKRYNSIGSMIAFGRVVLANDLPRTRLKRVP